MWLKILSPSPSSRGLGTGNIVKDNYQDANPDAVINDRPPKKTTKQSSSSKVKALVNNGDTRRLKMKQESSNKLLQSRSADQPEVQDNEAKSQPIKTNPTNLAGNSTKDSREVFARRYWVHSTTPPSPKSSSRQENPELIWNDLDHAYPNLKPTQNEPEPTQNGPEPTQLPCDVSCLTEDLNSVQVEEAVPLPSIIGLEDVKVASKAAFFNALWYGGVIAKAGKTAGEAVYQKSLNVGVSRSPNDSDGAALEITSTSTHTTTSGSSTSTKSQNKQAVCDEHKVVIEKRLTQKAKKARRIRRTRLASSQNKKSKSQSNPSRKLRFRKRNNLPPKKEKIVMDEESTIMIEEGDDCFLMTKEDFDDLVDTINSLTGKQKGSKGDGLCDCYIAKDIVDWFMSMGTKTKAKSPDNSQSATALMGRMDGAQLWKTLMDHDPTSSAAPTTSCFVDDDMRGSEDTTDSSLTGRTPKIRNTHTKFADDDMAVTTPSALSKRKNKTVPTQAPFMQRILEDVNSMAMDKGHDEDPLEEDPIEVVHAEFQPMDMIRTNNFVVAYEGESGQPEDIIETMLVSDEKSHGDDDPHESLELEQQGDCEYGRDLCLPEDGDSIFSVPIDEATDATQCGEGFMFDIDQKKYNWDHGQYKVNSRDGAKMPTIHEVDTIVYENCCDEDDGFSHDWSSITPDNTEHSIGTVTTETGGAISPVRPPVMMQKVEEDASNRKAELNRRLKELEAGLSQLQGEYKQIHHSIKAVETNLPTLPAIRSDWVSKHDGVEEHKEEQDDHFLEANNDEEYNEEGVMSI
ncbi:unnamed protein product [Cylindrotheca closterium]|uniref:Uncharacterized protein n=1 Tax=Cylindrotheca closterium TaxID=2856 RepID=A0AAD2GDP2_9STRA|nr:unnamed protein product [Cylindrotheca closterium]